MNCFGSTTEIVKSDIFRGHAHIVEQKRGKRRASLRGFTIGHARASHSMIFALKNGVKCEADFKKSATCPLCQQPVFSILDNGHGYRSHLHQQYCDQWALDETQWSVAWKKQFSPSSVDIPVTVNGESHLADIRTGSGIIMKTCFTLFPKIDIRKVESFFGERMVWIIDAQPLGMILEKNNKEKYVIDLPLLFTLSPWHESKRPLFFDINDTDLVYFESGADFELRIGRVIEKGRFLRKYNT